MKNANFWKARLAALAVVMTLVVSTASASAALPSASCSGWARITDWYGWYNTLVEVRVCVYYTPSTSIFYRDSAVGRIEIYNGDGAKTFQPCASVRTTDSKAPSYTKSQYTCMTLPPHAAGWITAATYPPHVTGAVVTASGHINWGGHVRDVSVSVR
jgi:hypothetical protein